jgi:hypothetical protein
MRYSSYTSHTQRLATITVDKNLTDYPVTDKRKFLCKLTQEATFMVCSLLMWHASCNKQYVLKEGKLVIIGLCVRTGNLPKPTFDKPNLDFVTKELFACDERLRCVKLLASNKQAYKRWCICNLTFFVPNDIATKEVSRKEACSVNR